MVALASDRTKSVHRAHITDLDAILRIERECFPAGIRETKVTFESRLTVFPEGFFTLKALDSAAPSGNSTISGYFCSEIWDSIPQGAQDAYQLDHDTGNRHCKDGSVLYISSFAVLPAVRGGAGRFLFKTAVSHLLSCFPSIQAIHFIVNEQWFAARHIYETEGFSYTGQIPAFFRQQHRTDSALIMTKKL